MALRAAAPTVEAYRSRSHGSHPASIGVHRIAARLNRLSTTCRSARKAGQILAKPVLQIALRIGIVDDRRLEQDVERLVEAEFGTAVGEAGRRLSQAKCPAPSLRC